MGLAHWPDEKFCPCRRILSLTKNSVSDEASSLCAAMDIEGLNIIDEEDQAPAPPLPQQLQQPPPQQAQQHQPIQQQQQPLQVRFIIFCFFLLVFYTSGCHYSTSRSSLRPIRSSLCRSGFRACMLLCVSRLGLSSLQCASCSCLLCRLFVNIHVAIDAARCKMPAVYSPQLVYITHVWYTVRYTECVLSMIQCVLYSASVHFKGRCHSCHVRVFQAQVF